MAVSIGGSALIGYLGSKNASNAQVGAANNATQAQLGMFNQTQQNLQPYMQGGNVAMNELMAGITPAGSSYTYGGTPASGNPNTPAVPGTTVNGNGSLMPSSYTPYSMSAFQNSPEYQAMMQQNSNALDASQNSSSMNGGANSNNMKSLVNWTQGNTLQGYGTGLQNYMSQFLTGNQAKAQQFNTLAGVAGMGQNAAANMGGFSTQVGGQIGGNIIGAGNAQAGGIIGGTNAITGGIGQGYNQYLQQQYMNNANGQVPGVAGGAAYGNSTDMTGFYTPTTY